MRNAQRLRTTLALVVAAVAACADVLAADRPQGVDAPQLRAGDKWTYRIVEGYREKSTWTETHEVKAAAPGAITVAVTSDGPAGQVAREETWSAPGVVQRGAIAGFATKRFEPALLRYRFPLAGGWSQRVRDVDKPAGPYGDVSFKANVVGRETVSTPAGRFDAVKIRYVYQLDDESLSNYPTQCEYVVWYSPEVGASVREQRRSWSMTKGLSPARLPSENAVYELTAFARAG
jgi:hypothetical protein